jgi:hypothetical protein
MSARGQDLRDQGIAHVAARHVAWLVHARAEMLRLVDERGRVSADDLHAICPPPVDAHPNLIGAVFRRLGLQVIDWRKSTRPAAHARMIPIYGRRITP